MVYKIGFVTDVIALYGLIDVIVYFYQFTIFTLHMLAFMLAIISLMCFILSL